MELNYVYFTDMGNQTPTPNPAGKTYMPNDGDFNATFFINDLKLILNNVTFDNDATILNSGTLKNNDDGTRLTARHCW